MRSGLPSDESVWYNIFARRHGASVSTRLFQGRERGSTPLGAATSFDRRTLFWLHSQEGISPRLSKIVLWLCTVLEVSMNRGGFSWKRLLGISAAKSKISRKIGIPLTRSGRQRKVGAAMGCITLLVGALGIGATAAAIILK